MNQLKTVVLLAALGGLLVVLGGYMGGKSGAMIALVVAIGLNFTSYWFSDRIVLSMYNAQEVNESQAPDLYHLVQQAQPSVPKAGRRDERERGRIALDVTMF